MQNSTGAVISIKNIQTSDGQADEFEIITEGNFYFKNGKYYIIYEQTEENLRTSSVIKVHGNSVSIKRRGAFSSDFVCREGERNSFVYSMPYGDIVMEIDTSKVEVFLGEEGGSVELVYSLESGTEKYMNNILVTVKKITNRRRETNEI